MPSRDYLSCYERFLRDVFLPAINHSHLDHLDAITRGNWGGQKENLMNCRQTVMSDGAPSLLQCQSRITQDHFSIHS